VGLRSRAPATRALQTPKTHPSTAIDSTASLHPPFRASMPEWLIGHLPVFGIGSKRSSRVAGQGDRSSRHTPATVEST
jgi:hypothetical protein